MNKRFFTWLNRNGLDLKGNRSTSLINCMYMGYIGLRGEQFVKETEKTISSYQDDFDIYLLSKPQSFTSLAVLKNTQLMVIRRV